MTEWLKEEEKPAVNKRKQEEKKPQKAEPNFFEEGVELRENALNVEVIRVASQRNQGGVYICKSEREAKELMQRIGGYESDIPLFFAILGKVQTATLRAAAMAYGIEPPCTGQTTISISTEKDGSGKLPGKLSWP